MFPAEGLVYDYRLDDAGISSSKSDDLIDDENVEKKEVSQLSRSFKWLSIIIS